MIYGYARVSTNHQDTTVQVEMLKQNNCEKIFKEKITGRTSERKQLQKLLDLLQPGDIVVVTKIDRIARNMKDGLHIIETIKSKGAGVLVLNMGMIDNTPMGKLIMTVLLAVAEFEVDLARERQREGIDRAKSLGKYKGRPKKYTAGNPKMKLALQLYEQGNYKIREICEATGVSSSALYRRLQELEEEKKAQSECLPQIATI